MIARDEHECAGCGICVLYCPMDDLESLGTIEVDAGICNDCLACIDACPERAPRRKHLSGAAAYLESLLPAFRRFATGQPDDGPAFSAGPLTPARQRSWEG